MAREKGNVSTRIAAIFCFLAGLNTACSLERALEFQLVRELSSEYFVFIQYRRDCSKRDVDQVSNAWRKVYRPIVSVPEEDRNVNAYKNIEQDLRKYINGLATQRGSISTSLYKNGQQQYLREWIDSGTPLHKSAVNEMLGDCLFGQLIAGYMESIVGQGECNIRARSSARDRGMFLYAIEGEYRDFAIRDDTKGRFRQLEPFTASTMPSVGRYFRFSYPPDKTSVGNTTGSFGLEPIPITLIVGMRSTRATDEA